MTKNNWFLLVICVLAVVTRLLPHAANVAPFTALALMSGYYSQSKFGFLLPILASVTTDFFFGFYPILGWVYGSYVLIFFVSFFMKKKMQLSFKSAFGFSLTASLLFFFVTNLGVWWTSQMYAHTVTGLLDCFIRALPFFRNSLIGDVYYLLVFWGIYQLSRGNFRVKLMNHPHLPAKLF